MKHFFIFLVYIFTVFYRPVDGNAWAVWAAYDTIKEAREAGKQLGAKGGDYEFRIVPTYALKTEKAD